MSGWNPFLGTDTAENYARARPNYHPDAVAAAARLLSLAVPVGLAVDVGCGSGMSSRALRAVADTVVGVDSSRPMLRSAAPLAGVHYLQATAERLPFAAGSAALVAAAAAFHWFDQAAMLAETARVLSPGGGFVTYTDYFSGQLTGASECSAWLVASYRARFPGPPRRRHFDADAAHTAGLQFIGTEELGHEVPMTVDSLTNYLLSQSNATSAIDSGRTTRHGLRAWIRAEIDQRMPARTVSAQFTGTLWCCRKTTPVGGGPAVQPFRRSRLEPTNTTDDSLGTRPQTRRRSFGNGPI
jgi:SAM-dependent methyltransferase